MLFHSSAFLAQFRTADPDALEALHIAALEAVRSDLQAVKAKVGIAGLRADFFFERNDDVDGYTPAALLEMKEIEGGEWKTIDWSDYRRLGMYPLQSLKDLLGDLSQFMQTDGEKIVG